VELNDANKIVNDENDNLGSVDMPKEEVKNEVENTAVENIEGCFTIKYGAVDTKCVTKDTNPNLSLAELEDDLDKLLGI